MKLQQVGAASRALVLLSQLDREVALHAEPGGSRLWGLAPPRLRRDYADGRIDEREFWRALRQWLRFEERAV